jgi:hypothetical protein
MLINISIEFSLKQNNDGARMSAPVTSLVHIIPFLPSHACTHVPQSNPKYISDLSIPCMIDARVHIDMILPSCAISQIELEFSKVR